MVSVKDFLGMFANALWEAITFETEEIEQILVWGGWEHFCSKKEFLLGSLFDFEKTTNKG